MGISVFDHILEWQYILRLKSIWLPL